ncbi:membrane-bound PQQ-dependent dehydrogenase, glucose/quinate/shikimate family [Coralloluteibacterium stylophorae]|uniref:Membrane-bound PQQ-dependent dehydrogenase, glucose/quinate/shikimate family n=2 Tax=Coralloluteibacterium stylophorae TaxID=1776034 RepID=A0AAP2CFY7_9GAMM|nr:membrane-bound PQQ-dependent dehydrogenase, glucose/quinate/shikimate family [Coralloluteibacterium stylophorae]MBS7458437.1 membrane-bound PQQ-dependent dehydrogenase, glucose/quinate/shikimate family [Coralloluteibacterium stylophorae]
MATAPRTGREIGWLPRIVGVVVTLAALGLLFGGIWLAVVGGSWYYLLAGIGMLVSGVLLVAGRRAGAWWYAAVFVGTLAWTIWESGLDYWRWVPRLDVVLVLGILVALTLPRLDRPAARGTAWGIAGAGVLALVVAFVLAFAPHGVTGPVDDFPAATASTVAPAISSGSVPGASGATQPDADWAAYGRGQDALRYTPLAQIDRDNVGDLERAWVYRTGDLPEERWGAETTPLKVGDTVYLCSARNIMIALDAASGEERWRYDPQVSDDAIPYTAACRGVVYYETPAAPTPAPAATLETEAVAADAPSARSTPETPQTTPVPVDVAPPALADAAADGALCRTRILQGTQDSRLIAVDAETGTPCPGFGDNGEVDITEGMGDVQPYMTAINSPPVIVQGVIVTGHQVTDGQYRWAPSGVIQGFDAVTGELRWAWDMGAPERSGRPPEGETYTLGTPNMWTMASGDEELGLVYLPMGNSAADYWSSSRRPFETPYTTALVAIDVNTGKPAWHFQTVHMDVWDYDLGSQATLVDFPTDTGTVPAVVLPSKQGDIYILDRRTGEPLVGVEERPAPQGGEEPEMRSPTQPHSLYHTLRRDDDLTERDMWGMTPYDQMACRIQFRQASYQGFYTPPTANQRFIEYPGYNGGSDWGGVAIDPHRGVIVANYNDMPNFNELVPREIADARGWLPRDQKSVRGGSMDQGGSAEGAGDPQIGTPFAIDVNAGWRLPFTGLLCKEPPYGGIRAIELATGRTLWDRPFGTGRANGPFGIPSMLPVDIGTPNNGGSVITASGLVFIAAATDNLIRAIDIETGETVWSDVLPAGGQATPMVYEADGREYLVIVASGHHFMETPNGDYVIAYALPARE